jgi:hypothetical protein
VRFEATISQIRHRQSWMAQPTVALAVVMYLLPSFDRASVIGAGRRKHRSHQLDDVRFVSEAGVVCRSDVEVPLDISEDEPWSGPVVVDLVAGALPRSIHLEVLPAPMPPGLLDLVRGTRQPRWQRIGSVEI